MNLTRREVDVALFIRDYRAAHNCGPTFQEIADGLGVSKVTAFGHVDRLRDKGIVALPPAYPQTSHRCLDIEPGAEIPVPDDRPDRLRAVVSAVLDAKGRGAGLVDSIVAAVMDELDPVRGGAHCPGD